MGFNSGFKGLMYRIWNLFRNICYYHMHFIYFRICLFWTSHFFIYRVLRLFSNFIIFVLSEKFSLSGAKHEPSTSDVLRLLPVVRQCKIVRKPLALLSNCSQTGVEMEHGPV